MPCNTDYMEPRSDEVEHSRIMCIYDYLFDKELKKKPINKNYWQGYHPKIYSQSYDKYVDPPTKLTITKAKLRIVDFFIIMPGITKSMPLEIQMWWRDERDRRREARKKEKEKIRIKALRKQAIAKLTKEEQEALGLI